MQSNKGHDSISKNMHSEKTHTLGSLPLTDFEKTSET